MKTLIKVTKRNKPCFITFSSCGIHHEWPKWTKHWFISILWWTIEITKDYSL